MKKTVFDLSIKCWRLSGKFYFDENQKFWWSYWSNWPCWIFKRWFDQCVWRIRRIICSIIVTLFELCGSYKHTKNHENVSRLCQRICFRLYKIRQRKCKNIKRIGWSQGINNPATSYFVKFRNVRTLRPTFITLDVQCVGKESTIPTDPIWLLCAVFIMKRSTQKTQQKILKIYLKLSKK